MAQPDELARVLSELSVDDLDRAAAWARATVRHLSGRAGEPFGVIERAAVAEHRRRFTDAAVLVESALDPIESGELVTDGPNAELEQLLADGWRLDVPDGDA